jgi:hypothetical protein
MEDGGRRMENGVGITWKWDMGKRRDGMNNPAGVLPNSMEFGNTLAPY